MSQTGSEEVPTTRVTFVAPTDLLQRFKLVAGDRHRTVSGELRSYMTEQVAKHERDAA